MTEENENLRQSARQLRALNIRMDPSSTGLFAPDQDDLNTWLGNVAKYLKMLSLVQIRRTSGPTSFSTL
jgi:hypothetical protein